MAQALRTLRPLSALQPFKVPSTRRAFITLPGEAQSLNASRVLPYKSTSVYKLIADVDSYSQFVPYCTESRVTEWSEPDKDGRRWPAKADLKIGWGGVEEKFTSRLFCVPGQVVEALSGEAETRQSKSELQHYGEKINGPVLSNSVFKSLSTTWSVKPFPYKPPTGTPQTDMTDRPAEDRTEVQLSIDFTFSNPIYAALSKAVAPKVAGIMIEAFEIRARRLMEGNGTGKASLHATFEPATQMDTRN